MDHSGAFSGMNGVKVPLVVHHETFVIIDNVIK